MYRDQHDERPGGVGIYFISHVGGHKFSANIMVYRRSDTAVEQRKEEVHGADGADGAVNGEKDSEKRGGKWEKPGLGEGAQCIWLARVRPEDCEGIIRYTVLQGKVVKPERQLRGGFDRGKGLVSW